MCVVEGGKGKHGGKTIYKTALIEIKCVLTPYIPLWFLASNLLDIIEPQFYTVLLYSAHILSKAPQTDRAPSERRSVIAKRQLTVKAKSKSKLMGKFSGPRQIEPQRRGRCSGRAVSHLCVSAALGCQCDRRQLRHRVEVQHVKRARRARRARHWRSSEGSANDVQLL